MLNALQYFVIATSIWAAVEIACSKFIHPGIRISFLIGIIYFAAVYTADLFSIPMVIKAWLLRLGLIVLFSIAAVTTRTVRRARGKVA